MIHEQEKLELLSQQMDIANGLIESKIMSREWIYNNIFDLNEQDKKDIFDGIVEDRKQNFRFEQIEAEGQDPAEDTGEETGEVEEQGEWGGDRRSGTGAPERIDTGYDSDDLKDATKYERERYGKRNFKGNSPLATSKGSTLVAREGLLSSLQKKFGKSVRNKSMLNEDTILDEE